MRANGRKIEFMWSKMRSEGLGLFEIVADWSRNIFEAISGART